MWFLLRRFFAQMEHRWKLPTARRRIRTKLKHSPAQQRPQRLANCFEFLSGIWIPKYQPQRRSEGAIARDNLLAPKSKGPAEPAALSSPIRRGKASSVGPVSRLRKCSSQENSSILTGRTSRANQEYDVLAALQARLEAREIFFAVHRLLVDFENNVAAIQVDVFGE